MDSHALTVLGYDGFIDWLGQYAASEPGRARVCALRPQTDAMAACARHSLYAQLLRLRQNGVVFPRLAFSEIAEVMARVRIEGSVLAGADLLRVQAVLASARTLDDFIGKAECGGAGELLRLCSGLDPCPALAAMLARALDPEGNLVDDASPELRHLRSHIRRLEEQNRQALDHLVKAASLEDLFQEKFVTLRNGRYVIPVKREARKRLPGVVHDHSDSGRTLFVEPEQYVGLGNELAATRLEERDECRRIYAELTQAVREKQDTIVGAMETMARVDAAFAAALWAEEYRCVLPQFGDRLRLRQARHPLLDRRLREQKQRRIVPLDIELPPDCAALVVTGSNSGGKTVALKTVGLLALIAQAGLPVPVAEGSVLPLFEQVFADIGDEQSLADNLSTFTGHLTRMTEILRALGHGRSLVLLDELGTGTDPLEGGALACAVLEELAGRGALTIATTHLGVIKSFAHEQEHMLNGAARFNTRTLEPEYTIEVGRPGASNALRIAERLGMPPRVLEAARERLNSDQLKLEAMLAQLEEQERVVTQQQTESRRTLEEAARDREALRTEVMELRRERRKLLHEAYEQAEQIVANTRGQMERLIAGIRETKPGEYDREAARHAREAIRDREVKIASAARETRPRVRQPLPREQLAPGVRVYVTRLDADGLVKSVTSDRRRAHVLVGGVEFAVDASELQCAREARPAADSGGEAQVARPRPDRAVSTELNLIGLRVHQALPALSRFMDQASLAGLAEVRIVHGFGTGRLMEAVHEYLRDNGFRGKFRLGDREKDPGGAGVTIVEI